jgi:hypothetical protein
MGSPVNAQFAQTRMQEVYDMLLMRPYFFTFNGLGLDASPLDTSQIPTTPGGFTHHQHSTPVYYNSPRFGPMPSP